MITTVKKILRKAAEAEGWDLDRAVHLMVRDADGPTGETWCGMPIEWVTCRALADDEMTCPWCRAEFDAGDDDGGEGLPVPTPAEAVRDDGAVH